MAYIDMIKGKRNQFVALLTDEFATTYKIALQRERTDLQDQMLDNFLDFIMADIELEVNPSLRYSFIDTIYDYASKYIETGNTIMKLELPHEDQYITVHSPAELFDYVFLYNIKANIDDACMRYLDYASGPYQAVLFDVDAFSLNINSFYSDEEIQEFCEDLTDNVLHKYYHLDTCSLFWDGESVLLLDKNYIDDYMRERLYEALLQWGKLNGFNSLAELDWWFE